MSSAEQEKQAPATVTKDATPGLDQLMSDTESTLKKTMRTRSDRELEDAKKYMEQYLAQVVKGQVVSKDVEANIKFWIKEIDRKLSDQLNEILHDPKVQKLEATWRGLHYLVDQSETGTKLQIKVMNVSKRELFKDLTNPSYNFDQTALFQKVYEQEFGQLGGHPYGMLVGDYDFDYSAEDVSLLQKMSNVAAAAHAPFIANTSPGMFKFDRFTELPNPNDLAKIFTTPEYADWTAFRKSEDSRYVALVMPRVIARLPYGARFKKVDEFNFEEAVDGTDHDRYLWMNASWAYASRITDAMAKYGWMARTRGVRGGGKVEGLAVHTFLTDDGGLAMKCPTEIAIPDRREFELSNLGFLPLLHCKNTNYAAFLGAQSCQQPKVFSKDTANANAELSAKINYIMCVSRFSHYLKVMARDRIGDFMSRDSCERWLNEWINLYVHPSPGIAGEESLAERPLAEARVDVEEVPGKPGWYKAVAFLKPHFQFETLTTSMRLVAQIPGKGNG